MRLRTHVGTRIRKLDGASDVAAFDAVVCQVHGKGLLPPPSTRKGIGEGAL